MEYPKESRSRASSIVAPQNPCQAPKYDAYIKFPMLLRNIDIIVGEKENKIQYFQSLLRSAGNSEMVQSWFPLLCRSNFRSGAEQVERRNTMGHVKENRRNGSNNFDIMNSDASSSYSKVNSEMRRESYGGKNSNNNNNNNNNDSSSSRSSFKDKNSKVYFNSSDNLDNVNVRANSNNTDSSKRRSYNDDNRNGNNYSHNSNNGNGNSNSHSTVRAEVSRHDHLSGEGRAYHHEQQITSRSSKWKSDSESLDNRITMNGRVGSASQHHTFFKTSASQSRRSSHGSYDSNEYNDNGKDRDSGRITRRY